VSHLRFDPLSGEWVTVSPRRLGRPVTASAEGCPFCPGGEGSEAPDPDWDVAVFDNRFPSYGGPGEPLPGLGPGYAAAPAGGRAEIVLYSPRHDVHLPDLPEGKVRLLVEVWRHRTEVLEADPAVACVFVFENRGRDAGQTIGHPHGQIYGYPLVPPRLARELERLREHRLRHGACLVCAIRAHEAGGPRQVDREGGWLAFVPFAPRFPSEVHLVPERHVGELAGLGDEEVADLARLLQRTVRRYDGLYGAPMPYVMAVYQRPRPAAPEGLWHLRVAFHPFLRAPGRLKYLAGSESAAGAFLLDASPEDMAQALRAVRL